MNKSFLGYMSLMLAQMFVGFNIILTKQLSTVFPLLTQLTSRFLITTIVILGLLWLQKLPLTKQVDQQTSLQKNDYFLLFLQGLFGNVLFNLFLILGMHKTSAITAGIITSFTPILIVVFALIFLKESLNKSKAIAIGVAVTGLMIVNFSSQTSTTGVAADSLLGDFLVFLALVPEALYTIVAKMHAKRLTPLLAAMWLNCFSFMLFLPLFTLSNSLFVLPSISADYWLLLTISAIMSAGFYILWMNGLKYVSANISALFVCMMPFSAILLGTLIFHETLNSVKIIGLLFILGAIVFNFKKNTSAEI